MTQCDLLDQLSEIKKQYKKETKNVLAKFARSNDFIKDGDIVRDHVGNIIKVHSRKVNFYNPLKTNACFPEMLYFGENHNINGTKNVKGGFSWVLQSNIELINGTTTIEDRIRELISNSNQ